MKKIMIIIITISILISCGFKSKPSGIIYVEFGGNVGYYDFSKQKFIEKKWTSMGAGNLYDDFHISWDNKKILLTLDAEGSFNFDERRYLLRNIKDDFKYKKLSDGKNIFDKIYTWSDISYMEAAISPDEKYIAISAQHFSELPLTIIDTSTGKEVSQWVDESVGFLYYGKPVWTNDNTLYFRIGKTLYKSGPSDGYKKAVKLLEVGNASYITVNPQGTKLAFRKNKHLWIADIDGRNLKQITTSEVAGITDYEGESMPVFSPDGKYIAFTSNGKRGAAWSDHDYPDGSYVSATGGKFGYLAVIPADGKLYDLRKKNNGVIILKNSDGFNIPSTKVPIWR